MGIVPWDPFGDVNDGDERADARHLPWFTQGWQRRRVELDLGYGALGLVHQSTGHAVVELTESSRPIPVTAAGLAIIDRIEGRWPEADLDAGDLDVISGEDLALRHLLLSRLADEGLPLPELFHTLPWHLVSELAEQVIAALRGGMASPDVRLRHWFAPAGSRFTAALDQIGAGLRAGDDLAVRVGRTALCTRLLEAKVPRVPLSTRQVLCGLMDELAVRDPFLAYWARQASERLAPEGGTGARDEGSVHLPTRLPAAADTRRRIRRQTRRIYQDPFVIDLTVTDTGRLEIDVEAGLASADPAPVIDPYHVMVLPLDVHGGDGERAYFVPLQRVPGGLAGAISIPLAAGGAEVEYEVGLAGPPIGTAEARFLPEDDMKRSLLAVRTRTALRPWQDLAAAMPAGHVLRSMVARATGEPR
ncbi:hypothetical protein [Acrocarpospora pleiomorpha]|uniref:hypothetical protein n=1 Tax=Acrocarpospora pleiomorpha TaxID=90975 RepID=UPI0012D301F9|nr:hypothetical protein [Acrocarpospora pleiomorpha]